METTIGGRIKMIRKEANLTQQKFADRLGLKQNTIATFEMDRTLPSERTVADICKYFNISESWLRTGEGEMYTALDRDEEIALLVGRAIEGGTDFQKALIKMLCSCSEKELEVLERKFREIAEGLDK